MAGSQATVSARARGQRRQPGIDVSVGRSTTSFLSSPPRRKSVRRSAPPRFSPRGDASCAEYHDALRLLALVLPAAAPDSRTSCVLRARVVVCAVVREPRAALHSPTPAHRTRRRLWQSDHQRGSAACTGGARLVRALLLCRQRTGARQLFGNDELFSLFGFGNVSLTAWAVFSSHAGAGWCVGVWPRPSRPCDS